MTVRPTGATAPDAALPQTGDTEGEQPPRLTDLLGLGAGTLADLMPSLAAAMAVPGYVDRLAVGPVTQAVVLLVDGLGWELLRANLDAAPFLADLAAESGRAITTGFPSTTVTSLGSLGTGHAAGVHGLVGYSFDLGGPAVGPPAAGANHGAGANYAAGLLNPITWPETIDPLVVQPGETLFQRATADGVAVTHVAPRKLKAGGLTKAALRGGAFCGADTMGEIVDATAAALGGPGRTLVYVYSGDLDNVGHRRGCQSEGWRAQLAHVDLLARHLVHVLPPHAALFITADHGMVDVPQDQRVDFDAEADLSVGVRALGGEARARHVYTKPGAEAYVLAAWRDRLAGAAWVLSRAEAVAAGWFGPTVTDRVLPRIGDVVVASRGASAVVARTTYAGEAELVGFHGSFTSAEMLVPLLCASP